MKPSLEAVARSNGGPFRRVQALSAGYEPDEIRALLRAGLWVALRRGVYLDALLLDTTRDCAARHALDVSAARLVVAHSVGSYQSAAIVHGLPVWPDARGIVVVTRPGRSRPALQVGTGPAIVVNAGRVDPAATVVRHGATVTNPVDTIVDIARLQGVAAACVPAEAALRDRLVDRSALCERAAGGDADALAEVARIAGPETESVLETISWVRFHEYGLELPARQRYLGDAAGAIGRVDFWWERQRVVGEADGQTKYRVDGEALVRERLRQSRLEAAGFTVVRWTWHDMVERPADTVARIRATLRRAA